MTEKQEQILKMSIDVPFGVWDDVTSEVREVQKRVLDTLLWRWGKNVHGHKPWPHEVRIWVEDVSLTVVRVKGELRGT